VITFQFRFRYAGRPQRLDLGHFPGTSLAAARVAHEQARLLLESGKNPVLEKHVAERAGQDATNVAELIDEFLEKQIRRKWKRPEYVEEILNADFRRRLGPWQLGAVTRREVVRVLEAIAERGAPVMANRTASLVKQLFKFGVVRGYVKENPCAEITRTSIGGHEKPRDEHLSYREIWRMWRGLGTAEFSDGLKLALKILLATGQRRSELLLGRWEDIDWDRQLWRIPADLSKNGKEHIVHLVPFTIDLFHELKRTAGASLYLVPSPAASGDKPITPHAINRAVQRWRGEISLPTLSPHLLRHTFATHVSGLGIAPHVVEKILNHSLGGMLAVYNHQPYYRERKEALARWADKLREIATADSEDKVPKEPDPLGAEDAAIIGSPEHPTTLPPPAGANALPAKGLTVDASV
jgi:integrase